MNFAVAGLRDGVGPLLTLFLVQQTHWSPVHLAWVVAMPGLASIAAQIPLGLVYDRVLRKQRLVAFGAAMLAVAAVVISHVPALPIMFIAQAFVGIATTLLSIGIPALSLASCGPNDFGSRVARNEICSKLGNFTVLGITGYLTHVYSLHWMFAIVVFSTGLVIVSSLRVPSPPVQSARAKVAFRMQDLVDSPLLMRLLPIAFLYDFANTSMLMIFEQAFTRQSAGGVAGYISSSLFVTQVTIMVGTLLLARRTRVDQPFHLLAFGFAMIGLRGLVFATGVSPLTLGLGQMLDGVVSAIELIVPMSALAAVSGDRFNFRQGALGTTIALAASASTITAGHFITHFGYQDAFLIFGALGLLGLCATIGLLSVGERSGSRASVRTAAAVPRRVAL